MLRLSKTWKGKMVALNDKITVVAMGKLREDIEKYAKKKKLPLNYALRFLLKTGLDQSRAPILSSLIDEKRKVYQFKISSDSERILEGLCGITFLDSSKIIEKAVEKAIVGKKKVGDVVIDDYQLRNFKVSVDLIEKARRIFSDKRNRAISEGPSRAVHLALQEMGAEYGIK